MLLRYSLQLVMLMLSISAVTALTDSSSSSSSGTTVHIIFMNHLDVGYSTPSKPGYIGNVLNVYFRQHYPQALKLLRELKQGGYEERFRYTTHPWLLDMYLRCPNLALNGIKVLCPNATELDEMRAAIKEGNVMWHAGPMNMQLENMNGTLMEAALNISSRLDAEFRIRKPIRVLSQRDVPGITSAVIPVLLRNRIHAVSVGVNPACVPPEVTREPFVWQDGHSGESVIGIWHPGGYPNNPGDSPANPGGISAKDCSMVSGVPHILCFSFRSDNTGPPQSVAELLSTYDILRAEFPGAELKASTFEEFVTEISPYRQLMQVVKTEIGDTWIQGIASDPRKMAEYRALSRAYTRCFLDGNCPATDPEVQLATRYLIKPPEHTWGLPSQPDQINYSNQKFHPISNASQFKFNENGWLEQRQFNSLAMAAAKGHILQSYMQLELESTVPKAINVSGLTRESVQPQRVYSCRKYRFSFADDGSLDFLSKSGGQSLAGSDSRLARFVYRSYDAIDDGRLLANYGNPGYGKPNITANANPISQSWPITAVAQYRRSDNCKFVMQVQPQDAMAVTDYGAPASVFVTFDFASDEQIGVELLVKDKTKTRIEEAMFLEFLPEQQPQQQHCRWWLKKVDSYVDPLRVTYGGTVMHHAVNDHAVRVCNVATDSGSDIASLTVQSVDVPLACPFSRSIPASPFPFLTRLDRVDGVSFNIYNNVWITNYIFWYPYLEEDANFKARFSIKLA